MRQRPTQPTRWQWHRQSSTGRQLVQPTFLFTPPYGESHVCLFRYPVTPPIPKHGCTITEKHQTCQLHLLRVHTCIFHGLQIFESKARRLSSNNTKMNSSKRGPCRPQIYIPTAFYSILRLSPCAPRVHTGYSPDLFVPST